MTEPPPISLPAKNMAAISTLLNIKMEMKSLVAHKEISNLLMQKYSTIRGLRSMDSISPSNRRTGRAFQQNSKVDVEKDHWGEGKCPNHQRDSLRLSCCMVEVYNMRGRKKDPMEESVVLHILSVRKRLENMREITTKNLVSAQGRQKAWYDKKARSRQLAVGDQVLVLLPSDSSKLLAHWQGPYIVKRRVGEVNYEVEMHDHRKNNRIFHIDMLQQWHSPVESSQVALEHTTESEDEEEDVIMWGDTEGAGKPTLGPDLSATQKGELEALVSSFQDIVNDNPGRTKVVEHHISIKTVSLNQRRENGVRQLYS